MGGEAAALAVPKPAPKQDIMTAYLGPLASYHKRIPLNLSGWTAGPAALGIELKFNTNRKLLVRRCVSSIEFRTTPAGRARWRGRFALEHLIFQF